MENIKNQREDLENRNQGVELAPIYRVYGVTKEDLDKLYDNYKNHLRESEYERLRSLGGSDGLVMKLQSDKNKGLCNIESHRDQRVKEFDDNINIEKPMTTCCEYVWESLKDLMIRILIVAAIVQIILGVIPGVAEDPKTEWVEGFSIIVAIFVVVSVGSITNYTKEKSFRALNKKTEDDLVVSLIRDGSNQPQLLHPDDVVVGDVINVKYGDMMKVDGIVLTANEMEFDESPLTGESVKKNKITYDEFIRQYECEYLTKKIKSDKIGSSLIYSGSRCCKGNGTMLVLRVGKNSEKGKIAAIVVASQESEDSKSPLEEKLDKMAGDIGKFGLAAAIITFVALIIRFGVSYHSSVQEYEIFLQQNITATKNKSEIPPLVMDPALTVGNKILKIILLCIAIIVVAIPEGLPLAVTLSLAFAIKKMQDENNLVRFMTSCETMGTANYICSDKTGTLTTGKMTVKGMSNSICDEKDIDIETKVTPERFKSKVYQNLIINSIALNIDVKIEINPKTKQKEFNANSSDKAFFDFLEDKLDTRYEECLRTYLSDKSKVKNLPFDSEKKCMSTIVKNDKFEIDGFRCFHKGGGDEILKKCSYFFNLENNKPEVLTGDMREKIKNKLKEFAGKSLRNIIFAYKDVTNEVAAAYQEKDENGRNLIEKEDFIYLGIAGITDPLKDGVENAVLKCQSAGIKVIMVTGDNIDTAISISKQCKILTESQYEEVRHFLDNVDRKVNERIRQISDENNKIRNEVDAVYVEVKPTKKLNQEEITNEVLRSFNNRKFLAIEGKELSELVGLVCKTCGKTLNDRYEVKNDNSQNRSDEVIMKLTNERGADGVKKCYCLPNLEVAKKFFRDIMKREMKKEDEDLYVKKEELGNSENFLKIIKNLCVISRAKPEDKYLLVFGLRKYRNVVAVTGDGTNDAPALSKADVGFSMGIAGTDVAKDASDIILLDDNFCSIVNAVKWGRNIFDCIRKFVQFQLCVNICACFLVFITACIGNETPLSAIQMLWVNLIMDSLGSLALATEPPNIKLLEKKPFKRSEYPVSRRMWKHILIQSIFQLALMLILYLVGPDFLVEDDPSRIAQGDLFKLCFGGFPGRESDNGNNYVMNGSENAWKIELKRKPGMTVRECSVYYDKGNLHDCFSRFKLENGNSSHMTIIFNVFVIYTLFNQINARVLDDSFNIFVDIQKNLWFVAIELLEMGLHVILIQLSGKIFKVSKGGLTGMQWLICILFGMTTFVISVICKLIPDNWFSCFDRFDEKEEVMEEQAVVPLDNNSIVGLNNRKSEQDNLNNEIKKSLSKQISKQGSRSKYLERGGSAKRRLSKQVSNMQNPNKN
jgi:magnesium-transporting ATPase (P-type)